MIPGGAYYGPFTARAVEQYRVTGRPAHPRLVDAYVMIKRAAAVANVSVGALDRLRGGAITEACDRILAGDLRDHFVVDMINSGAGTAFNMNANEVIANAALRQMGKNLGQYSELHPNDHVNMSQSSNDTFPTAMHVSVLSALRAEGGTLGAVDALASSLSGAAARFAGRRKVGRTHLMDALPVTLGGEFAAYATAIRRAGASLVAAARGLERVALGGTAVGTGANAPRGYRKAAVAELARVSGLRLRPEPDMQFALQSRLAVAEVSSAMRNLAVEAGRIASDVRLMASGPASGLAEISVPAVHAGSSIMPGKVNPSLAECMNMVCHAVVGNDAAVAQAAQAGQFELNVMLPGMLRSVLDSADMLARFVPVFSANMLDGLAANAGTLERGIAMSPAAATALAPRIGYQRAAALFKESLRTGRPAGDLAVEEGMVTKEQAEALLR